jgi:nicotinate-nucleotide pyrophosphorylase (carboxylating)
MYTKPPIQLIGDALLEDIGQEDITTTRTVPEDSRCRATLFAKQDGVLSGIELFRAVFDFLEADIQEWDAHADGDPFVKGDEIATFQGKTRAVLTGERVALNFVQRLSGIASITARYVEAVKGTKTSIVDTRKTTPLLRKLEKRAVIHGGGMNHRHTLFNGVLLKENHIMAAGSLREALKRAQQGAHHLMKIEVEVKNLEELREAVELGADVVMLDNMSLDDMKEGVAFVQGKHVLLEASGNVTIERATDIAAIGVDIISVGALTHSAPAVDLSLLIENH